MATDLGVKCKRYLNFPLVCVLCTEVAPDGGSSNEDEYKPVCEAQPQLKGVVGKFIGGNGG